MIASVTSLRARAKMITTLVRLTSFDTSTEEGRSRERFRRILLTAMASAAAKLCSMLTLLISVPLTLHYLGTERYGLWMTISSTVTLLAFADLGMGNGMLNAIAEAHGKDDREAASRYVTSGFLLLGGIGGTLLLLFALVSPLISWAKVFNVSSPQAVREVGPALAVLFTCFAISMPIGIVDRVQIGYQEGYKSNLWQCAGSLLGLTAIIVAIRANAGLPWLIAGIAGMPVVASLLNAILFFGFQRPWLWPRRHHWAKPAARQLFRTGLLFFVLQVAIALAITSDNLVAARVLGPRAVAQYSVAWQLFSVVTVLISLVLQPLWPAYGEAMTRGDLAWVKRQLARSVLIIGLLTTFAAAILVLFGGRIIGVWTKAHLDIPFLLLLGLGFWIILSNTASAVGVFLNGANVVRFQVICASTYAVTALLLKVVLAHSLGVAGIIWATVIAYSIFVIIPFAIFVPRYLRSAQGEMRV